MTKNELRPERSHTNPRAGETLEGIARRELADRPLDEATRDLQSWNQHLLARIRSAELLPSDIVFLEPPLA